uniref:AMP-dependent synthetase/ligase domain-containing protein n=1 Tax=Arcella intermedia TaxID=1963864 RepID=A0A6B2KYP8_9EUKA
MACHLHGFVVVPITPGLTELQGIIRFAQPTAIVCSKAYTVRLLNIFKKSSSNDTPKKGPSGSHIFESMKSSKPANEGTSGIPTPGFVLIQMEKVGPEEYWLGVEVGVNVIKFGFIENLGIHNPEAICDLHEDSVAVLIYGVRASGTAKCVPLTHKNIVAMQRNLFLAYKLAGVPLSEKDVALSVFPISRINEYIHCLMLLSIGSSLAFLKSDSQFWTDIELLRPTVLSSTSLDFVKLHTTFKIAVASLRPWSRFLFNHLLERKLSGIKKTGGILDIIEDRFITKKFRRLMGGRLRILMVHSKGYLPESRRLFLELVFGCPVEELYLRTETGVVASTASTMSEPYGTGFPMCDVKLIPYEKDPAFGEICIRGDNVAKGYLYDKEGTSNTRFMDGWYHTNEIGLWKDGQLKVYGHTRDTLEPVPGKIVFLTHLEAVYAESDFVHQIIILGRPKEPLVAVVVPDYELLYRYVIKSKLKVSLDPEQMYHSREVISVIGKDLRRIAQRNKLEDHEEIKMIYLSQTPLPAILLLQRSYLTNKFAAIIDDMYAELKNNKKIGFTTKHLPIDSMMEERITENEVEREQYSRVITLFPTHKRRHWEYWILFLLTNGFLWKYKWAQIQSLFFKIKQFIHY